MTVILTDGNVQDPRQVENLLAEKLGDGRLFVVGIGEDVKQENILRFAEYGRGVAAFVAAAEELEQTLTQLFGSVSEPLAWDLDLDLGSAEIERITPSRLPDLYAGRSVSIKLKVRGELPAELKLHTETMAGPRTFTAILVDSGSAELAGR
jgi:Ca-activated chloride channel family protein